MYYVYIIECSDKSFYTGYAANIEKRIKQHLGIIKGGAKYTKSHKPEKIVLLLELEEKNDAQKLEYAIKQLTKKEKILLIKNINSLSEKSFPRIKNFEYKVIISEPKIIIEK